MISYIGWGIFVVSTVLAIRAIRTIFIQFSELDRLKKLEYGYRRKP